MNHGTFQATSDERTFFFGDFIKNIHRACFYLISFLSIFGIFEKISSSGDRANVKTKKPPIETVCTITLHLTDFCVKRLTKANYSQPVLAFFPVLSLCVFLFFKCLFLFRFHLRPFDLAVFFFHQ